MPLSVVVKTMFAKVTVMTDSYQASGLPMPLADNVDNEVSNTPADTGGKGHFQCDPQKTISGKDQRIRSKQ